MTSREAIGRRRQDVVGARRQMMDLEYSMPGVEVKAAMQRLGREMLCIRRSAALYKVQDTLNHKYSHMDVR